MTAKRIRFGPYEADLTAGELRRNGRRIHLQEQPFQVLAALLERAGEVVTRDELRERLWPNGTFVEFESGLNTAVKKLRVSLGDSAETPQFIETLPKRGYRFTFPVEPNPPVESVQTEQGAPAPVHLEEANRPRLKFRYALPIAIASVLAVAGYGLFRPARADPDSQVPLRRFTIRPPEPIGTPQLAPRVAVSPDGKHVAFVAGAGAGRLWIQDLDQQRPRAVEGSEGALGPFWSPDSSFIGFAAATRGSLNKVSSAGGLPMEVCKFPIGFFGGGTWSPDGKSIVFSARAPSVLYEVPAEGGTPKVLLSPEQLRPLPDEGSLGTKQQESGWWIKPPHFLPAEAGPRVLGFALSCGGGSFVMVQDVERGRRANLMPGRSPFYSPSGHLIYMPATGTPDIWAQPFSLSSLKPEGEAFLIVRNGTDPSVGADGTLVYLDAFSEHLVWVDRRGQRIGEIGKPAQQIYYPAISPDGRSVAFEALENANLDIWVYDIARGARTRLTENPATDILPVWSPGGEQVAFGSYRAGNTDMFLQRADAGAEEQVLPAVADNERVSDWSRDGRYILYSLLDPTNGSDLWYLKRNSKGEWEPHLFLQTSSHEKAPKFSPDGRYVAYVSDESGRDEVYVRPFPESTSKWVVSNNGGTQVRWCRNGRELFYVEAGTLLAVPVRTVPTFSLGAATRLFSHFAFSQWSDPNYDVAADGERILLPQRAGADGQELMIRVVQNWFAEFRNRK